VIRLNEIDRPKELFADLEMCTHNDIDGFVLPMIYTAKDVEEYDRLVSDFEKKRGIKPGHFLFIVIFETPGSMLHASQIAKASTRNHSLVFGHNDYLNLLRGKESAESMINPRGTVVMAAR
jgi:citrate lyase beta subunit